MESHSELYGRNPHMAPSRTRDSACPFGTCDGSGFVLREEDDAAVPCRCRPQRVARARTSRLASQIPRKYRGVAFDRHPVTRMEPTFVRAVRRFCEGVDDHLDAGDSFGFFGDRGTGKTTLAMLIAQYALRARRTVAIYTAPWLLSQIRSTYEQGAEQTYLGLMERLAAVDLLQLDDMAVASQTDWTLEQLYTIVNRRYEDRRSVVLTADVESPERLGEHVGSRTSSRLLEMCEPVPLFGTDNRVSLRSSARAG
jgi:DNA replication protein DnaC